MAHITDTIFSCKQAFYLIFFGGEDSEGDKKKN